jgi:hypothetical protein
MNCAKDQDTFFDEAEGLTYALVFFVFSLNLI